MEFTRTVNGHPYRIVEKGRGVPLFWIHGMFHSLSVEDQFAVVDFELLSSGLRLIRIELPAHGESGMHGGGRCLSWQSLAEDIAQLANTLAPGGYYAGGFSQGAGIAAHLAVVDTRVKGLVLAMLPQIWEERPVIVATYKKLLQALNGERGNRVLKRLFRQAHYPPQTFDYQFERSETIVGLMLGSPVTSMQNILEGAILSDFPKQLMAGNRELPLMLAGWENDPNHPVRSFYELKKLSGVCLSLILQDKSDIYSFSVRILQIILSKV